MTTDINNLERMWREILCSNLRHCPCIYLEKLEKITKAAVKIVVHRRED
jgi:hypothetical protein